MYMLLETGNYSKNYKYTISGFNQKLNINEIKFLIIDPYRILNGGSRSAKTSTLLNLINHQPDIDKILFLCQGSIWSKIPIVNQQGLGLL